MSTIINGTTDAVTFPDGTIQNTSALVAGKTPYANLPAGSVLQVINATTSTTVSSSTATFVDTTLTGTITPKFATSKILVIVHQNGLIKTSANPSSDLQLKVVRNGSDIISISRYSLYTNSTIEIRGQTLSTTYLDSPASTSALTYKTQFNNPDAAGSVSVQNEAGYSVSTITLMEIAQ